MLLVSSVFGCSSSALPPEVKLAQTQEHDLWRAGAEVYAPEDYARYKTSLRKGKDDIIIQEARLAWFRDYKGVEEQFKNILVEGNEIFKKIQEEKLSKASFIEEQLFILQSSIRALRRLTSLINEGRLSRQDITKAELILLEAQALYQRGQYHIAEEKLTCISEYLTTAEGKILPILNRYSNKEHIAKWKKWVDMTVYESKAKGIYAIVVSKVDRKLIVYKNGVLFKTYEVNIGRNGFSDKIYSGDNATPEGKYKIIKKLSKSKYYKALLINYPNEEDKRQFASAKRKGLIPADAGIGGLVEIHGGGKSGMTFGCISLDNKHMDELFGIADIGTPVTIVGAVDYDNTISSTMKGL
ncbi:MAG: L,D-transpeptidase [Nitrospirae bacterium]|nr:L,D-transpeptidase [Nitrospirota bacterium]